MKSLSLFLTILFFVTFWSGGVDGNIGLYEQCGLSLDGIASGKIWQLFSYALLHGNIYHLVINVSILWLLGCRLEALIGKRQTWTVLALAVLTGGVVFLLASWISSTDPPALLVGVSGGLMGLLLAITTVEPHRVLRPLRIRMKHLGLGFLVSEAVLTLIDPALSIPVLSHIGGFVAKGMGAEIFLVAHACHLGGGVAGYCYGRYLVMNGKY